MKNRKREREREMDIKIDMHASDSAFSTLTSHLAPPPPPTIGACGSQASLNPKA